MTGRTWMDTHTYGHGARASTLWGKGPNGGSRGRTIVAATVGALALLVPVSTAAAAQTTYVAPGLLAKADKSPTKTVHVIAQSTGGATAAESATQSLRSLRKRLGLVGGVAVGTPAGDGYNPRHDPG